MCVLYILSVHMNSTVGTSAPQEDKTFMRAGVFVQLCLLVSSYYTFPNQRSRVYLKFVFLYFVTFVSRQIQVLVINIKQSFYRLLQLYIII